MDKKNTTIGVVLIIAAFGFLMYSQRFAPRPPAPAPTVIAPSSSATPASSTSAPVNAVTGQPTAGPTTMGATPAAVVENESADANITVLENDFVRVSCTDFGGAIRDVALKKFPAELGGTRPYVFNSQHSDPMLSVVDFPGLDRSTRFQLVSHTPTEVVYRAVVGSRFEVLRHYALAPRPDDKHDPYQLRHETTFRNLTAEPLPLPRLALSVGTSAPVNDSVYGRIVTSGYSDGKSQTFNPSTKLAASSGFFGVGAHDAIPEIVNGGPIAWSSVDNQFFVSILTPDQPAAGLVTRRVRLAPNLPDTNPVAYGLTAATQFDPAPLPAHGESVLGLSLYVGPKEYHRLANSDVFKVDQDKVMQFGKIFGFFSQLLNTLMTWMHGLTANWGIAIILATLTLKTLSLPFTLAASRSARRMQKIQPEMQAVREKFKDNPQKLQAATMELFKKHKVNPMGGCIPLLITMPFFFGFYTMLRSTAELRFVPFLWAHDLSAPDTVAHLFGLPINIMPILLGATMIISQHLTPMPQVDNAQAKMMKFMPYMFALFCYNFSCALALYSTVNGIFQIGQQLAINRLKDDGDPANTASAAGASPSGKPIKNVTPKKR